LPAAPLVVYRWYLITSPGRCPRRRSECVAGTSSWRPGRCPRRRSLWIAGLC
jgi:predicted Zn-ribbon and HTH transcriptional regulator